MLPFILFLIGGFFWSALPWGAAFAATLQAMGMYSRRHRYRPWLERSPATLRKLLVSELAFATFLNTLMMVPGNLIMGIPVWAP